MQRSFVRSTPDVNCDYSYDNLGRITQIHAYKGENEIVKFDYEYEPFTNNIDLIKYGHRDYDPCNTFSYDWLDRLIEAEYGIDNTNEIFSIDKLGNRTNVNLRDTNDVDYVVDNLTNRYESVDGNSLEYNAAGNLTKDKDGYEYEYDYENRIVKITKGGNDIAQYSYDCLGRRVEKKDCITAANTRRYYYSYKWQVLNEYDGSDSYKAVYVYGNYIDEVLVIGSTGICNYIHDHLYSTVALTDMDGDVVERYEYDVYGNYHILEPNFADDPDGKSDRNNFYLFTGRRVDILDDENLKLMIWPFRSYSTYLGRWYQHDKLGIVPNDNKFNLFNPKKQYDDGINLYEYSGSNPVNVVDIWGLFTEFICCTHQQKQTLEFDEAMAQLFISLLKMDIQSAINADKGQYPWFTSEKLKNALKILDKASAKIDNGKVKCESKCGLFGSHPYAWALPFGDTVHVCPRKGQYSGYWDLPGKQRCATLVHEGTHLGSGTTDAAYFYPDELPHDVLGFIGWDIIASTYDTWIMSGFCVPGYHGSGGCYN